MPNGADWMVLQAARISIRDTYSDGDIEISRYRDVVGWVFAWVRFDLLLLSRIFVPDAPTEERATTDGNDMEAHHLTCSPNSTYTYTYTSTTNHHLLMFPCFLSVWCHSNRLLYLRPCFFFLHRPFLIKASLSRSPRRLDIFLPPIGV